MQGLTSTGRILHLHTGSMRVSVWGVHRFVTCFALHVPPCLVYHVRGKYTEPAAKTMNAGLRTDPDSARHIISECSRHAGDCSNWTYSLVGGTHLLPARGRV